MNFRFMESRSSQAATEAPRLTIGIPTWNRAGMLRVQLDDLTPHLRDDIELVICDNGSTDGTWELLEAYLHATPFRVRCVRNATNLGADVNYLRVLEAACGDWVWMVGDDDRIHFAIISALIEEMRTSPADAMILLDRESATEIDSEYVKPERFFDKQYDEVGTQVLQVGRVICKTQPIRALLKQAYTHGIGSLHSYSKLYGPVIMHTGVNVIVTPLLSKRQFDPPRWNLLTGALGAWNSSVQMYGDQGPAANKREIRLRQRIVLYLVAGNLILGRPLKKTEINQMYAQFNMKGKAALFALRFGFRLSRPMAMQAIRIAKPALIPKIKANAAHESAEY